MVEKQTLSSMANSCQSVVSQTIGVNTVRSQGSFAVIIREYFTIGQKDQAHWHKYSESPVQTMGIDAPSAPGPGRWSSVGCSENDA